MIFMATLREDIRALSNQNLRDLLQAAHAELQHRAQESRQMAERIDDLLQSQKRINAKWDALAERLDTEAAWRSAGIPENHIAIHGLGMCARLGEGKCKAQGE